MIKCILKSKFPSLILFPSPPALFLLLNVPARFWAPAVDKVLLLMRSNWGITCFSTVPASII